MDPSPCHLHHLALSVWLDFVPRPGFEHLHNGHHTSGSPSAAVCFIYVRRGFMRRGFIDMPPHIRKIGAAGN